MSTEIEAKLSAAEQALPTSTVDIKVEVDTVVEDEKFKTAKQVKEPEKQLVKQEDEEETKPVIEEIKIKKTTARQYDDRSLNNKYDPSTLPASEDPEMIRNQVEFYFGDSNLASDKHMRELIGCPENNPVKVSHICTFKRMKRFQPYSAVVAALRGSDFFKLEGAEGEETITRSRLYSEEKAAALQEIQKRSVYVKGFGDEEATTQFDVEAFFMKFGTVKQVRLRRTDLGLFKGSCFAEFEDLEVAKKFLNLDPKPLYKDSPLLIKPRIEYEEQKKKEIMEGKKNPSNNKHRGGKNGNYRGRGGRGGGGGGDPDDWKKRRDTDRNHGFQNGRGRGGRGRGGGGRGRGGRGGRDHNDHRDDQKNSRDKGVPVIKSTVAPPVDVKKEPVTEAVADVKTETEQLSNKRARDENDASSEAPAAKKEKLAEE